MPIENVATGAEPVKVSDVATAANPVWSVRDARNPSLSHGHKAILFALASRLRDFADEAWPAVGTLAADAGIGESQGKVLIAELITWGVLSRRVVVDNRGRHNVYRIVWEVLSGTAPLAPSIRRQRPAPRLEGQPERRLTPDGSAGAPSDGSAGAPSDGSAGAPTTKIPSEAAKGSNHGKQPSLPGAPLPDIAAVVVPDPAGLVSNDNMGDPDAAPRAGHTSTVGGQMGLLAVATAPSAPKASKKPSHHEPTPSEPIRTAYRIAYAAAFPGRAGEVPLTPNGVIMGAPENAAAVRLLRAVGAEQGARLVRDALADPNVRQRFPTILQIAKDPGAVRAALSAPAQGRDGLSAAQQAELRGLVAANPNHPVAKTLAQSGAGGSIKQLEWIRANQRPNSGPVRQSGMTAEAAASARSEF